MSKLISAINLEYKTDHNLCGVENIENGNETDIEFSNNVANSKHHVHVSTFIE